MEEKPRTVKDLYKAVKEPIDEHKEEKEKEEERLKFAENSEAVWQWGFTVKKGEGGHADVEKMETDERHEKIEHWEEHKAEETSTAGTVESMLAGLDEELGMEPIDHGDEHADASGQDETSGAPDNEEAKPQSPAVAAAPEPKQEEKKDEAPKDAETPELAYWPQLLSKSGEQTFTFAANELHRIRQIGFAFRKAQAEAKKKAVEAAHDQPAGEVRTGAGTARVGAPTDQRNQE